jgi:hypothetical protein
MVCNTQNGLCPSSGILNTKKHNVQKLDMFSCSGNEMETSTLSGPLERANLNDCPVIEVSSF